MATGRSHGDACGGDGEAPLVSERPGEGGGGGLWTRRVCPACGEDVDQTVILDQEAPGC